MSLYTSDNQTREDETALGPYAKLRSRVDNLMHRLTIPEEREDIYIKLNIEHSQYPNMTPLIWKNENFENIIVNDIISLYPAITAGTMTMAQAQRLSKTLTIVEIIAQHPLTRSKLIASQIPIHIYPLLQTMYPSNEYEFLRISSISIIATLVRSGDPSIISYFIFTGFIPIALVYMEYGTESCRLYSIFIIRKMLNDKNFLKRICGTSFILDNILTVLNKMVISLEKRPVTKILRHVIKTYLALIDNDNARAQLKSNLPKQLQDNTFVECFNDDFVVEFCLKKLNNTLFGSNKIAKKFP